MACTAPLLPEEGASKSHIVNFSVELQATKQEGTEEEVLCVKSTFLDMGDGLSLKKRFRTFRKASTDGNLDDGEGPEVYEPGIFSSELAEEACAGVTEKDRCSEDSTTKTWATAPTTPSTPSGTEDGSEPETPEKCEEEQGAWSEQASVRRRPRTTVMMRNLPNNYTRSMLLQLLDSHDFAGQYDFLYLPIDFTRKANLGYAFVNLVSEEAVAAFWKLFDGFSAWSFPSSKVCEVSWSGPKQGFKAHVDRYKNSPVMHKSVPDEYKPMIFVNGVRKKFPAPTIRIQHPKKVRSTFVDLKEGQSLTEIWRQLRPCKSDRGSGGEPEILDSMMLDPITLSSLTLPLVLEESDLFNPAEEKSYTPGKFSDEQAILKDVTGGAVVTPKSFQTKGVHAVFNGYDRPQSNLQRSDQWTCLLRHRGMSSPFTVFAWNQSRIGSHTSFLSPLSLLSPLDEKKNHTFGRSTVMMRNVPNNYTREMLLSMLNVHGLEGKYDFVYLPHDFDRSANLGYAFVNLVSDDRTSGGYLDKLHVRGSQEAVRAFWESFDGFKRWSLPSAKAKTAESALFSGSLGDGSLQLLEPREVCRVSWSGPHQGLAAHVERYRNSPVMHRSVPDEYRPVVFTDGVRQPFPCPTRKAALEEYWCVVAQSIWADDLGIGVTAHARLGAAARMGPIEIYWVPQQQPIEPCMMGAAVMVHIYSPLCVRSTFLDLDDGKDCRRLYRELRKAKTESDIDLLMETEVYHPGKFSDERMESQETSDRDCPEVTSAVAGVEEEDVERKTTVMLRNLPLNYSRDMLLTLLDKLGFSGCYDFAYLPCDFERRANLGYAFVNLVDEETASRFWQILDGFSTWALPSAKVCRVSWSGPHQGLAAHVERASRTNTNQLFSLLVFANPFRHQRASFALLERGVVGLTCAEQVMQFLQGHGQSTFLVSFDQMRASIAAWSKLKFSGLQFDETAPLVRAGEAENKGIVQSEHAVPQVFEPHGPHLKIKFVCFVCRPATMVSAREWRALASMRNCEELWRKLEVLSQPEAKKCLPHARNKLFVKHLPIDTLEPPQRSEAAKADEVSEVETTPGSSPRRLAEVEPDEQQEDETPSRHVIVKGTFIELTDGSSMMQRYKKIRKLKTDSVLAECDSETWQDGDRLVEPEIVISELDRRPLPEASAVMRMHVIVKSERAAQSPIPPVIESPPRKVAQPSRETQSGRTTVMLRNIPNNYTRQMFLQLLSETGFHARYDFVYLPCDFQRDSNLGYAFINLVDSESVEAFWNAFEGFSSWAIPTAKVGQVTWSGPHQGFEAHVERYRNSPVMHRSVPEEYKPLIFMHGEQVPFPPPTRRLKAPTKNTR
ncbi:ML1 [Symbiodinium natans]|uniref:ML1 protein n=1 Tax=Symbiodinium natans TaxID=878477 RepID=A0A812UMC2_9DINO|nr:ML1 [Symbiodinium natans]